MQCFANPCPKPKCKFILFLTNCCQTYSIVLLLHYLTHMLFKSHESFSNLYLAISLLSQYHNKSKMLNQNPFNCLSYLIMLYCMVCLCCAILIVRRATCLVERSKQIVIFKRQVTHISFTYFYYCISVFQ
jgi:hypothetical protein